MLRLVVKEMDDLEGFLQDLQSYENDPVKAEDVIKGISELFRKDNGDGSISNLIFLVFGENGIIPFVKRKFVVEENKSNISSAFQLLEFLLVNYESFCVPYVHKVQQLCLDIVLSGASAKIKENSVKLLKCLFAPSFIVVLDISKIITTIDELKTFVQPSVLSQMFSVMGIIFEKVPEISHTEKDKFFQYFLDEMEKTRTSTSLMEGCFNGIYGYLVNFIPNKEQISNVYSLLKENCCLKEGQTRRVTERSALRIVERHYRVFALSIYNDIEFWRKALEPWIRMTKEDRQLGLSATVSIYRAIAHVFETSNREISNEKLNEIVEDLLCNLMTSFKVASMVGVVELVSTGHVRDDLANRVLQLITKRISTTTDGLMYLPVNLECVSKYMTKSKTVKPELLLLVERMAVALIDGYPRIDTDFRRRSLESLGKSFYHLRECGDQVLDDYVKEVVYQGLVRNCSHQVLTDVELIRDIVGTDMVSYRSYLPLWMYLMNVSSSEWATEGQGGVVMSEKIFDEYVSSFLKINKRLDLRVEVKNPHVTDPEEAGEAVRANDFKIFINNVSLFVDLTEDMKNPDLMGKWLPLIFTETVNSSYRSPLISGFYKVITSCLKIADKITYFWEPVTDPLEQPDSESDQWFRHLQRFLQDVSVRVGRYKGELQISCFHIFLSAPMKLIEPFLRDLVPIFRVILRAGSGHLPLLRECLSTLERWYTCLGRSDSSSKESVEYLLRNILPYFNVFLQSKERRTGLSETVEMKWRPLKVRGKIQKLSSSGSESELLSIQRKFLLFLGKLDHDICKELIRPIDDDDDEVEEWSKKLWYDVPLTDSKLRINMDELLPRVMELSLSSTDRRTRLNACEFLHSVVLLTIGNMKQMNGELNGLFRKLVNACLILGCDSDLIVFQIYEPLMMQMVHYFAERERESSQVFINCLMESASHPFNSTLRDFSAVLIREFTEWSIRGQDPGEIPGNLKAILRSMYSFSLHSDHSKRRGAAVVFNNICLIIQEEANVLNTHWFLLYFHFTECLNICTAYDDTSHIINAVECIRKSITEKSFTPGIKVPAGFKSNSMDSILEYVFSRCAHPQTNIRTLSMKLYESIGKYSTSVKEYVRVHGSVVFMKPEYLKQGADVKEYVNWLEYNTALFSYYDWLLIHEAVTESELLTAGVDSLLGVFLDNLTPSHPWFEINTKRIVAIIQVLEFLTTCVKIGVVWYTKKAVCVIKTCLFTPNDFKFEFCDVDNREKLDSIFAELLPRLADRLSDEEIACLLDVDFGFVCLNGYLHPDRSLREMVERVNGLKTVHRLGLWHLGFHRIVSGDEILKSVFESVFHKRPRGIFSMNVRPGDRIFLEELLRFGMKIGMSRRVLFDLLKNKEEIFDAKTSGKTTKGEFFIYLFRDFVYDSMVTDSELSLKEILQNFHANALEMIVNLLKHADVDGSNGEMVVSNLCKSWFFLVELEYSNTLLLPVVKCMCSVDPNALLKETHICEWIYRIMKTSRSLEEMEAVFELLPYLTAPHEESNDKLTSSLNTFYENQRFFSSVVSSSDPKVSIAYGGFLKGFIRTKSLPLLREITKMLTKYDTLLKEQEIDDVLSDVCRAKVPEEHLQKILSFLYGNVFSSVETLSVYQCFLRKILKKCEQEISWSFLLENLDDAVRVLKSGNLSFKIAVLETVQACVAQVKREELENLSDSMKGVFRSLITICSKRELSDGEPETQRKYACACFNTLCTVIAARTNDPLQYKCLIFKDDFSVLPQLINREKVWSLRMDFDDLPKRSKVLTALRKTITKERQMELGQSVNSVKYLEEETLFNSSLAEDLTKYDFSSYFTRSGVAGAREETGGLFRVELEMDDLNKHECMATIIGIIQHMVEARITPDDVPFWLSSLMRRMTSLNSSENEKIFLLKLMCNIDEYVKLYAGSVIPDLLNTLLDVFDGKPINYLVIDVITMILNWKTDLTTLGDRMRSVITRLAIYIVKKSDSYRKDIIKSNIEIAKLIIETCRDIVNAQLLSAKAFEALQTADGMADSTIYLNLHFCGVLLANAIPPWLDNKEEEFIRSVLQHCHSTGKIGKLAAQVCGMTLRHLENADCADRLVEIVRDKIQHRLNTKGLNELLLVHSIHKKYPKISSMFVNSLRNCAWTIRGPFRVQSLEMLLTHVRRMDRLGNDGFAATYFSFLEDMCSADDLKALDFALQITESVLRVTDDRMDKVVEKALTFDECKMAEVRRNVYNIAIAVLDGWEHRFSRSMHEDIVKQCKIVLLNGMNDSDDDSREKCVQFWQRRTRGSTSAEQFSRILREVYTSETEEGFLNFAATLVIRSSADSPDYQNFIFEHPLVQNSTFRAKNILKTVQPSTIAPMFAQTLTGQLSQPGLLQSLSSAPSSLQTLFLQGTMQQDGEDVLKSDKGEASKKARRFVRDPKKIQLYFAKKQKMKKAEMDREREKKALVELLKEYSDGDFPNIQITHRDLLKPLEVLTMRDAQIGRYFLTSVYDGFMKKVPDKAFLGKIRELVQQVMEDSTENNPSFIAFLFHVLLRCDGCVEADSEWVARLAKSSGCLSLGKLLIEEMITRAEWDEEERDRRSGLTPEEIKWLHLAEICRELKEFEVIRGIFLEKLRVVDHAADAIRSESVSDWFKAAELYESVLKRSLRSLSNFYEDAYSNCLARLSDWTKLRNHIQESYNFEDLWSDLGLAEKVLPWFVRSETMRSLLSDGGKSVMEFIEKLQGCPDKESDLKKFFVVELAIAHFSQGNFEWLRYHLYQMSKSFLSSWSHWNKWSNTFRHTKLMELQLPWELESCCSVLTSSDGIVSDLLDQWSRNHPRDADDLMTWDVKLTCRNQFLSMMETFHPDLNDFEIVKSSVLVDFGMVKAGIAQRNVQLSQKYVERISKRLESCKDHKLRLMHEYYTNSLEILNGEMYCSDRDARCFRYVSAVLRLEEIGDRRDVFSFESYLALSRVMGLLEKDLDQVSEVTTREVAARLGLTFGNVKENLKAKKLRYLEKALERTENDAELQSKTLMEIVKHYRTYFGYTTEMAKCLLRAMNCGNPEARHLFCCLLNEPKFAADWVTHSELRTISKEIPTWMYLLWTNQILANLDSEMFPFLMEILLSLTEDYPNAIRYPFGLSKETYKFAHPRYGRQCRLFVDELTRKLSDASHADFLTALSYVTPPDLVFRYDLDMILAELSQIRPKWDRIVEVVRDLHKRMYGVEYGSFRGAIFERLSDLKPDLEVLLTLKHEKPLWMEKVGRLVKAIPKVTTENVSLKSYSPWLYRSVNRNVTFELPRQQNRERPILSRSVTVWSFRSNVLVMKSKCRPIRITVLGNDAKEYKFLIKFGEDLRQDQRIQQVFGHMNHVLRGNRHTSALSIDTYNVLPLKSNLGMIEWVSNTSSLHELLTKTDERVRQTMERVQQVHLEFLAQDDSITKAVAAHLSGYLKVGRTEAVSRFNERVHSFEWDLLRKAFWRMSLYPEQFVCLRNNFAVSQAVIYIAHWLVGIGDRHLDNTLVSSRTGRALGIDFGCAFGFATEFLTPPELLPFRLTPQIVNVFKPMGESVLIKETMIQSLRAFHRERGILIAALEVFASEPTLDWLEKTKRDQKSRKDGSERIREWNPRQKIAVVREKLEGVNPVKVFTNDLISGHSDTQYLDKYLEVLHGDGSRSQVRSLTEEEQVNCLIDLATDHHILCKTYVGWNPWL